MFCDKCNIILDDLTGFIHNDTQESTGSNIFIPSPSSKYYQYTDEYNDYRSVDSNVNFLKLDQNKKLQRFCDNCLPSMLMNGEIKQNSQLGGIIYPYICISCHNVKMNPPDIGCDFNIVGNNIFGNYKSNTVLCQDMNHREAYYFSDDDIDIDFSGDTYYVYAFGKMEPAYISTNIDIICHDCCMQHYILGDIVHHDNYMHHLLAGHTFETLDFQIDAMTQLKHLDKFYNNKSSRRLTELTIHRKQLECKKLLHDEIKLNI